MKTVGVSEARTHLYELLHEASNGETIRITRRGAPVAKIIPDRKSRKDPRRIVREIREIRKGISLKGLTTREMVNEGRRY
jgi:prevent-host-death family protein